MRHVKSLAWAPAMVLASVLAAKVLADDGVAVTPAPRQDASWQERHANMNAQIKTGNVDMIFIGDSITYDWEGTGKDVWRKFYARRNAVNLGIGGDQTGQVLWRLDHGNIEGISPKVAVVMIGTNNAAQGQSAEQIAEGIAAIIAKLRTKLPETKILLLGIFPRGANDEDPIRKVTSATNEIIAKLADGQYIYYLDIGAKFVAADGTLSKDVMPDLLHLNAKSYETWAEAIEPTVAKLLGEP